MLDVHTVVSSSYDYQKTLYDNYVSRDGQVLRTVTQLVLDIVNIKLVWSLI